MFRVVLFNLFWFDTIALIIGITKASSFFMGSWQIIYEQKEKERAKY